MSGRFLYLRAAAAAALLGLEFSAAAHPDDVHLVPSVLGAVGWQSVPAPPGVGDRSLGALSGPVYGCGLGAELRLFEVVGLEVELLHTRHAATAPASFEGARGTVELRREGLSLGLVPRLAPGEVPLGSSAFLVPLLELGATHDFPSESASGLAGVTARKRPAWLGTLGLGAEVGVVVPMVDLRFPILLRAGWDPAAPEGLAERWAGNGATAALDGRPALRLALVLGVSGHLTLGSGPPLAPGPAPSPPP